MYPSRLVLIALSFPVLIMWLRERKLRGRFTDTLIIIHALWAGMAIFIVHGSTRMQAIRVYVIEVVGCHRLGRMLVHEPDQFRRICKVLVVLVAMTISFAVYKSFTSKNLIADILGPHAVSQEFDELRLRFYCSQTVFVHPTLYGIVADSTFCLAKYVNSYGKTGISRHWLLIVPVTAGFFPLSSAAFSLLVFHSAFITWDKTSGKIRNKWRLLGWGWSRRR